VGSDTRERLIRATGRLLRSQGYAGTGLNQVVAEAQAPKGSMYFHFPGGKEELAAAAIERFADRITARLTDVLDSSETVADAVARVLDGYVTLFEKSDFQEGCAVAAVAVEAAPSQERLAAATGRALRAWTGLLAAALEAEGRSPTEAHGLATLTVATMEGSIVMSRGLRSTEPFTTARDALHPLLAPPSPDRAAVPDPGP
jgi:TetR/AcrR family transcriptional repressor of lmrAB and yxaGH operons